MIAWNFFEECRHAEPNPVQQLRGVICNEECAAGSLLRQPAPIV